MKRLALAVALALSITPALADENGAPFEQTVLDRQLPSLPDVAGSETISKDGMPFEQAELDRALPDVSGTSGRVQIAQLGGGSYMSAEETVSPWSTDHNVIAPAQ